MDLNNFMHKTSIQVRSYEVDVQGVVHNSNLLRFLEIGRIEYRKNFGYKILKNGLFDDGLKIVVVNNTINYKSFAFMDNTLDIYTRISWIKNSSFCFEQLILNAITGNEICQGRGVLVNIDNKNNLPVQLPQKFVDEILKYEKNLEIIR